MEFIQNSIIPIFLGLGLAASCGFRIFVPMLVTSIAAYFNVIPINDSLAWLGSVPSILAFGIATLLEVVGYWFPYVDHLLDLAGKPLSVLAGSVLAASTFYPMQEEINWLLPIIAGGGTAGALHLGTSALRLGSTAVTGGVGNPLLSSIESILAVVTSIVTVIVPVIGVFLIVLILFLLYKRFKRKKV